MYPEPLRGVSMLVFLVRVLTHDSGNDLSKDGHAISRHARVSLLLAPRHVLGHD